MQPSWIEEAAVRSMMGDAWWFEQKLRVLEKRVESLERQLQEVRTSGQQEGHG